MPSLPSESEVRVAAAALIQGGCALVEFGSLAAVEITDGWTVQDTDSGEDIATKLSGPEAIVLAWHLWQKRRPKDP